MFIQRRWFLGLRREVQSRKRQRLARTESVIFNFLNIERKGFNMLLENAI
jgi:hypothetical protein